MYALDEHELRCYLLIKRKKICYTAGKRRDGASIILDERDPMLKDSPLAEYFSVQDTN